MRVSDEQDLGKGVTREQRDQQSHLGVLNHTVRWGQAKVLDARYDDPGSIPMPTERKEETDTCKFSSYLHSCTHTHKSINASRGWVGEKQLRN